MNEEIKQQIKKLPQEIARATSAEILNFRCPQCQDHLVIHYTPGDKKSMTVSCENSCFDIHFDGMSETPKWVELLGSRIVTARAANREGNTP